MKNLKSILIEGLADWDEGDFEKSIKKDTSLRNLEWRIKDWIKENTFCDSRSIRVYGDEAPYKVDTKWVIFNKDVEAITNGLFKWGRIDGNFECKDCKKIKTLENGPEYVEGNFICWRCENLESLNMENLEVRKNFNIIMCPKLKSLEGGPIKVTGDFNCRQSSLESLKGAPMRVWGDFIADGSKDLESLDMETELVHGDFIIDKCTKLKSLKGSPEKVDGNFRCRECPQLNDSTGVSKYIGGNLSCNKTKLKPKEIDTQIKGKIVK